MMNILRCLKFNILKLSGTFLAGLAFAGIVGVAVCIGLLAPRPHPTTKLLDAKLSVSDVVHMQSPFTIIAYTSEHTHNARVVVELTDRRSKNVVDRILLRDNGVDGDQRAADGEWYELSQLLPDEQAEYLNVDVYLEFDSAIYKTQKISLPDLRVLPVLVEEVDSDQRSPAGGSTH